MAMLMQISTWLTAINIVLILGLLYVYVKNLNKIKSLFTSGLVIFGLLFLIQNIVYFYFSVTMMPYYVEGVENYVFIFTGLQTLAFTVLNWITWK